MPTSDSDPSTATLVLEGVWLHDPEDAASTAVNYIYGAASREHTVEAAGVGTLYAGRTFPVVDYGEHEEETLTVVVHIPHGSTYADDLATLDALARAKRTLWLRDNRGRSFAGTITAYKVQDQKWGAAVAFTFGRVHYAVEEVAA
ncbi:MAG TPA: hypothetical protein VFP10_12420 [Candidatus Eisenbacteria bacterium]|nr:hypothetical protein [Candidatus Eisenbacteria bacterium]